MKRLEQIAGVVADTLIGLAVIVILGEQAIRTDLVIWGRLFASAGVMIAAFCIVYNIGFFIKKGK